MRHVLTFLACCLVALLTAALAGPWLVDWSSHREFIEAQLSSALHARVTTRGAIDLKLLPTPRLSLGPTQVSRNALHVSAESARVELAVMSLLRGEWRFIDAEFEAPEIEMSAAAFGGGSAAPTQEVRFERILIHRGRLRLATGNPGAPLVLDGLELEAEAASLAGPFKGAGSFVREAGRVACRFNTGVREAAMLRLKLICDEAAGLPRADFDGIAQSLGEGAGARLNFEGAAQFSGAALGGWRAAGPLQIDAAHLRMEPLEAKIGGEDSAPVMSGAAQINFGADARVNISLKAPQFDLDRLLASQTSEAGALAAMPAFWLADRDFVTRAGLPWRIEWSTQALSVGGETLTNVAASAQTQASGAVAVTFAAAGPGRSLLRLDGDVQSGPLAQYRGKAEAGARDIARLADWLAPFAPDAAARLRSIPFAGLDASGDVEASRAGLSVRNLSFQAGRSKFNGAASFTPAEGGARAKLIADLTSPSLDLDTAPDLTTPSAALANMDFSLALKAQAIRLARFGDGAVDAGQINFQVNRTGDALRLQSLSLANVGGANLQASGEANAAGSRWSASLDAQRLTELAALAQRVAPGVWPQALAERAVALSPARLTFGLESGGAAEGFALRSLQLSGSARGTRIEASVKPHDGRSANALVILDSEDAAQLMRQFGFEALQIAGSGRGRLSAEMQGDFAQGFTTTARAQIAGLQASYTGFLGGSPAVLSMKGQARAASPDAGPFLRMMALGLPDLGAKTPFEINSDVSAVGGKGEFSALQGELAGSAFGGALEISRDAAASGRAHLRGALAVDRFSAPAAAALVLGAPAPARGEALWSSARFGAALAEAPLVDIEINAKRFDWMEGRRGEPAKFTLSLAPGAVQFKNVNTKLGAAQVSGSLGLRRDGRNASVIGNIAIGGYRIDLAALGANANARLEFSSTGETPAALAAGLAGGGEVQVSGLQIPRADPRAPARVLAMLDEEKIGAAEADFRRALLGELSRGPLILGERKFDATMASGVLRLARADGVSGSLDLGSLAVEARADITAAPLPKDWVGEAPRVSVTARGNLGVPASVGQSVEAQNFYNSLSARAIIRETAKIERLEADIQERAAFGRRLRGLAFMRQREAEIAAWKIEQARLAAEAEQRAEEEERRTRLEALRIEKERLERERREAEARRREAEAAARRDAARPAPPVSIRPDRPPEPDAPETPPAR